MRRTGLVLTRRAGFGYEFRGWPDGYEGLAAAYGLRFGSPPRTMEFGLRYRALVEKQVDIVAGSATDGAIAALDLVVLEDDRRYFPPVTPPRWSGGRRWSVNLLWAMLCKSWRARSAKRECGG